MKYPDELWNDAAVRFTELRKTGLSIKKAYAAMTAEGMTLPPFPYFQVRISEMCRRFLVSTAPAEPEEPEEPAQTAPAPEPTQTETAPTETEEPTQTEMEQTEMEQTEQTETAEKDFLLDTITKIRALKQVISALSSPEWKEERDILTSIREDLLDKLINTITGKD